MKKKLLTVLMAAAVSASLLAGCGSAAADGAAEVSGSQTEAGTESAGQTETDQDETRTITDIFGREVVIPAEVNTAAALGSAARFMVYAGAQDKIAGVTEMELKGDAGMPYAYANAELFANCTALASGGSSDTDYTEAIVDLSPDVIFYHDSDTAAMEELAEKTGLPVIGVYGETFLSEEFTESIELIGEVMGTEEHAEKTVTAIKGWISDLNDRTKDIAEEDKPAVYAGAVSWSGGHGFTGTYGNYAPFTAINAKNVVDETGVNGFVEVDMEQVLTWDPQYIFLNPGNMDFVNDEYATDPAAIGSLSAVQNGDLYAQVNFNYYWCNMELAIVDAYYAGSIIYPEQFSDVNFDEKAEEIFNTMIGMDYLDVLEENGIGFGQMTIGATDEQQ